jgi:phosphoribosylanthranilate isomerase
MTAVKICGLTRLEDALWAAHCGADLLGFICWPGSPRYIAPGPLRELVEALRAEGCPLPLVGVFVDQALSDVREVSSVCGLDMVQLHGGEPAAYAAAIGLPYLLARRIRQASDLAGLEAYDPWGLVLDSYDPGRPGGTGQPWRWDLLAEAQALPERVILAGGLTPENVRVAMRVARPWGVDVATGVERAPGVKDPERVAAFVAQVREEDGHDEE